MTDYKIWNILIVLFVVVHYVTINTANTINTHAGGYEYDLFYAALSPINAEIYGYFRKRGDEKYVFAEF